MWIGLDFDNTIVCYDCLFYRVALESGLIPADLPAAKVTVRDHLRKIGRECDWTEMQGVVYGPRMSEAEAFPGVIDFLRTARAGGANVCIVSHRTRHPFLGEQYDLHQAAQDWVSTALKDETGPLVPAQHVFFEVTKEAKIARIAELRCDYFVDDLPEILLAPQFPTNTQRILFDPGRQHGAQNEIMAFPNWDAINRHIASHAA